MPSNPETHLISAVLRAGDLKTALAHGMSVDMFHTCREEWQWMEDYYRRYRKSPSMPAFTAKHPDFRVLRTTDTAFFTDEVRKGHARHLLIAMVNDIADDIASGDVDTAVKKAGPTIISIASSVGAQTDSDIFRDYTDILQDVRGRVARTQESGASGIPSGFDTIDHLCGGYNPGDLIAIGARLGHGKSWFLQHSAATAAAAGYNVVFATLEMSRQQASMRIHTLLSSSVGESVFRNTALMQGKDFDMKEYRKFLIRLKKRVPGRLHIIDASRGKVSPLTIAAQIERHQPDIVFVDYLTLMARPSPDWQGTAQLSADMQSLPVSYDIPVVVAVQLNRAEGVGRGAPPGPEAIAQSDAIGQDAAVVINTRQHSPSVVQMYLAKNRHGRGGTKWWVKFDPDQGSIKEISYQTALDLMDKDADRDDAEDERPRKRHSK